MSSLEQSQQCGQKARWHCSRKRLGGVQRPQNTLTLTPWGMCVMIFSTKGLSKWCSEIGGSGGGQAA